MLPCEQHRALGELGPPERPTRRWSCPATVAELQAVVADAPPPRGKGQTDRRRARFSGIGVPTDIQVRLSQLRGVVSADAAAGTVTLAAGTHLHGSPGCSPTGPGRANLGDVDRQTVAGATSTGTHGTGAAFGGISTRSPG